MGSLNQVEFILSAYLLAPYNMRNVHQKYMHQNIPFPSDQTAINALIGLHWHLQEFFPSLSNHVYRISTSSSQLVAHLYNSLFQSYTDRTIENQLSQLMGQKGLGPKVIACSKDCRIEEYIQSQVISQEELLKELAKTLAEFHGISQVSLSKRIKNRQDLGSTFLSHSIMFNEKLATFSPHNYEIAIKALNRILKHRWKILAVTEGWKRGLCHCDLNEGNMICTNEGKIRLLDFEFICWSYPELDIANFFLEKRCNYGTKHPPYFKHLPELPEHEKNIFLLQYCKDQKAFDDMKLRVKQAEPLAWVSLILLAVLSLESQISLDIHKLLEERLDLFQESISQLPS